MTDPRIKYKEEELSIKDLILKVQELSLELWKKKSLIIISSIVFGLIFLLSTLRAKKEYTAELSFMLNDDERSEIGIGGVLGQFGLSNVAGESNYDRILELSKTRKIIQNAVFEKCIINGNEDFLSNHFINNLDSLKLWQKKKWYSFSGNESNLNLKDFRFKSDSIANFSTKENKALKVVHKLLVGDESKRGILNSKYDESSGIMRMAIKSADPELSVVSTNILFESLSKYYIDKTIEKQKQTYEIVEVKADSIYAVLSASEAQLAAFKDSNRGLFNKKDNLREAQLMREIQKLNVMYVEATKNKEIAQFTLQNKTPYIQLIDQPILPIKGKRKSKIKYLILGALLGAFLSGFYVLSKKIYSDIMDS